MARKFLSNHPSPLPWGEGEINAVQYRRKNRKMPPHDTRLQLKVFENVQFWETTKRPADVLLLQGQSEQAMQSIPIQFDGTDGPAARREFPIRNRTIAQPDSRSQFTADCVLAIEGNIIETE